MNPSEWAGRVGISKFTAYRWFREGTLPALAGRVGRLILVDLEIRNIPLLTWLDARRYEGRLRDDMAAPTGMGTIDEREP